MTRLVAPLVVVAVIVILAVGAVAQIGPASSPYRRTIDRSFAVLANAIVAQSNASGVDLNDLSTNGPGLSRATFLADLDAISAATGQDSRRFAALTPPDPAGATVRQCGTTLVDRQGAATEVRDALERLLGGRQGLGGGDEAEAATALSSAGRLLRAADASWVNCRRTLARSPGSARLLASTWVSDPASWTQGSLGPLVAGLVTRHPWRRSTGCPSWPCQPIPPRSPVAPASASCRRPRPCAVRFVLANVGNVDELGVILVVSAVAQGTVAAPAPVRERVAIDAGDSVALSPPPLRVGPGRSYALHITATAPGGAAASLSLAVRVSVVPPLPTTTTVATTTTTTTVRATTTTAAVRPG